MTRTLERLEAFTIGYAHAMLWANVSDESGEDVYPELWQTPGKGWQLDAFAPDARESVESDCRDFYGANLRDLAAYVRHDADAWRFNGWQGELAAYGCAGHDFALTRNGHGAGYWDRGMGDVGDRLADAARVYGESTGYVNDADTVSLY